MAKKSTTKTGTKKKSTAKKKSVSKKNTGAVKKSAPKKKFTGKSSQKTILKRKFDNWVPEILFAVQPDAGYENAFSAPPVFPTKKKDSARLKKLLLKPATLQVLEEKKAEQAPALKEPAVKKKAASKAPPAKTKKTAVPDPKKKSAVSIQALLMQKYDSWKPESFAAAGTDPDENIVFTAPPAIDETDPDRVEMLKALLLKTIDFKSPVEPFPMPEEMEAESLPEPETAEVIKTPETPETQAAEALKPPEPEPGAAAVPVQEAKEEPDTKPEPVSETNAKPEPEAEPESGPLVEPVMEAEPVIETENAPKQELLEKNITQTEKCCGCIAAGLSSIPGPLKALIGLTAVIIALIVTASLINMRHYYMVPSRSGIEILKGNFTPRGKVNFEFLPLAKAPEPIKEVYTKSEAYDVIFRYYIKKSGKLADLKPVSDLKEAEKFIGKAGAYALTSDKVKRAQEQLDRIKAKLKAVAPVPGKK